MDIETDTATKTSYLRRVGADFFKYWPTMVIPTAIALITMPIYTRLFSPEDYGYYVLVNSTIMLVSTLGTSWVESAVLRFYAEYKQRSELGGFITTTVLTIGLSLAIILVLGRVVLAGLHLRSSTLAHLLDVGLWVLAATAGLRIVLTLFRASLRATEYAVLQSINVVVGVVLGLVWVLQMGVGISGLLYGTGLIAVLLIPVAAWRFPVFPLARSVSRALAKDFASYGFPLAPTLLGNWMLSLSDRFILEHFRGAAEVGWYSVSHSLAEKVLLIPFSALMFAATPILIAGWERGDRAQVVEGLEKLTRWFLLLGMPLLVGISVLAKNLVSLLVGKEFVPGYRIVAYVSAGVFLWGLSQYVTRTFVLLKRTSTLMWIVLLSSALSIGANLLLVPRLGFVGAGISAPVAYGSMLALSFLFERRYGLYRFPWRSSLRIGLASLAMGLALWGLGQAHGVPWYVLIPVGMAVYCGSLVLVRELGPADWQQMRSLVLRRRPPPGPSRGGGG